MTVEFDLFWSFRSPYSYLAAPRLLALTQDYDVVCRFHAVRPIAVRIDGFFKTVNPLWPGYVMHDLPREAEQLGLPITWPNPDPIVQDMRTMEVAKDQPYITHLTRLGIAAERQGKGLAFATHVAKQIWGGVENWDQGSVLADAAAKAGLVFAELEAELTADKQGLDTQILANEDAHTAAGHWGVPLMSFNKEPFFGQDRVQSLIWRLQQHGLSKR